MCNFVNNKKDECDQLINLYEIYSIGNRAIIPDAPFYSKEMDNIHIQCGDFKDFKLGDLIEGDIRKMKGYSNIDEEHKKKYINFKNVTKFDIKNEISEPLPFKDMRFILCGEFDNKYDIPNLIEKYGGKCYDKFKKNEVNFF